MKIELEIEVGCRRFKPPGFKRHVNPSSRTPGVITTVATLARALALMLRTPLRLALAAVVLRAAQAGACSRSGPSVLPLPSPRGLENHSAFIATGSARSGPWGGASRSGVASGLRRSPRTPSLARPLSRRSCATQLPATMIACSIPAIALRGGASVVAALPTVPTRDLGCLLFGLVGATAWLKIWTTLASMGYMDPKVSRKVVHCGSAPLFMLTWPFYSASSQARLVAALVPMVSMIKLLLAGYGRNDKLVSDGGGGGGGGGEHKNTRARARKHLCYQPA